MGRLRFLVADLYFAEKQERLVDPAFLREVLLNAVREWSGETGSFPLLEDPSGGYCGICPMSNWRMTIQTFPKWDFMTLEILSSERNPDPKLLYESLVTYLEPSVVSMETLSRGHHLAANSSV